MKKQMITLLLSLILILQVGCGNTMVRNGYEYDTVGVLSSKNAMVKYDIIWGNVIMGGLFFSTIIAPVYFFGFSMEEPVALWSDYNIVNQYGSFRCTEQSSVFDNATCVLDESDLY